MIFVTYSTNTFAEEPGDIVDEYFDLLKQGQISESIDFLYSKFRLPNHLEDSLISKLPESISETKQFGQLYSCNSISNRGFKNTYLIKQYICFHEYKPIRYVFDFYRPNGKWKITGVSFYGDVDEIIKSELIKDVQKNSKRR